MVIPLSVLYDVPTLTRADRVPSYTDLWLSVAYEAVDRDLWSGRSDVDAGDAADAAENELDRMVAARA